MSGKGMEGLIEGILSLASPGKGPKIFVLDKEGKSVFAAGMGPRDWNGPRGVDAEGRLVPPAPPGWKALLFPMEVYGKNQGYLGTVVPEKDAPLWEALLSELHAVERDRRLKEYENEDLTEATVRHHEEITLLIDLPHLLNLGLEAEVFWDNAMELLERAVKSRRAYALRALRGRPGYQVICAREGGRFYWRSDGEDPRENHFVGYEGDEGLAALAMESGRLVSRGDLQKECMPLAPFEEGSISALVVPLISPVVLKGREQVLGAVVLLDREKTPGRVEPFRSTDRKMADLICNQIATLLGNQELAEFRKEVEIAGTIQKTLLPSRDREIPGFDLAGRCEPAHYVGGDYYDYIPLKDGSWGVLVADVSGHNLASALLMPMARKVLNWVGRTRKDPSRILAEASRLLYKDLSGAELFLTLFFLALEPGKSRVLAANAGHNPPLLFRRGSRRPHWLDVDGPIMGFLPEPEHKLRRLTMNRGDLLVLYTDGVTEVADDKGEMLGAERFQEIVESLRERPAKEILEGIFSAVRDFGDSGQDDVTVVVVKKT